MELLHASVNPTTAEETQNNVTPTEILSEPVVNDYTVQNQVSDKPISGLSQEEIVDPNQVSINIADKAAPIVVLFGPGKCGKTMTQIRLARYLHEKGYTVNPVRDFRPAYDTNYKQMCDKYSEFVNNTNAAPSTDTLSFMLLEVLDPRCNRLCQILEAPGEHYHSIQNPQAPFPAYINQLIASSTRKLWVVTLEPNWIPAAKCQDYNLSQYVAKIKTLKTKINKRDRVLFLYNKIDATSLMIDQTTVNKSMMFKDVANHFVGVFAPFRNQNPITSWWRKYNCDLLPFSTGTFSPYKLGTKDETKYDIGSSVFPEALWRSIMSFIKG